MEAQRSPEDLTVVFPLNKKMYVSIERMMIAWSWSQTNEHLLMYFFSFAPDIFLPNATDYGGEAAPSAASYPHWSRRRDLPTFSSLAAECVSFEAHTLHLIVALEKAVTIQ